MGIVHFQKLRVFGCLCFPWFRPYTSHKLDAKSTPCVFLGYSITQSAYFCLDRSTSKIYTSRHVIFHEQVFFFFITFAYRIRCHWWYGHYDLLSCQDLHVINTPAGSVSTPQEPVVHTTLAPAETSSAVPDTQNPSPTIISATVVPLNPSSSNLQQSQPASAPPPPARQSTRQWKPVQRLNLHTKVVQAT